MTPGALPPAGAGDPAPPAPAPPAPAPPAPAPPEFPEPPEPPEPPAPPEPPELRGVFSWLPWFISLSALAHIATFFTFNVVYPQRATIPPAASRIFLLTASSAENIALLNWIDAEDPARTASAPNIEPPGLVTASYLPSYRVIRTSPIELSAEPEASDYPPAKDPLAIIRFSAEGAAATPASVHPEPTAVRFSAALAARALDSHFVFAKSREPLEPARFLIGVSSTGEVRYTFLQTSCGNHSIDEQAASQLRTCAFARHQAPITWGYATFAWGDELFESAQLKTESAN